MTTRLGTLGRWRRAAAAAQAAVLLGLPFLRVGGESALRFDLATQRLHVLGATIWMDEFFLVLAAALAATFAFLLATLLLGRLWCGWACPQTALVELTRPLAALRARGGLRAAAAWAGLAAAAALVALDLTWYFVPPALAWPGPVQGAIAACAAALVLADLALWRDRFCATTCPYAKLQGALLDRHSLVIAYDAGRTQECVDCGACVRACPVGLDIRDGLQAACTSCAACVDACAPIMRRLRRAPKLVGYFFGVPAAGGKPPPYGVDGSDHRPHLARPPALALAGATAAALALLVSAAAGRSALDLDVAVARAFAPRRLASGETVVALDVGLENRGAAPLALALAVDAPGVDARLRPDRVALAAGEHRRLRVVVSARGLLPAQAVQATLSATAETPSGARARAGVTLAAPEPR